MPLEIKTMTEQVAAEVLEEMAFMFAETVSPADLPDPENMLCASIQFKGPHTGQVDLAMPQSCGAAVAANILGVDPSDPKVSSDQKDSVAELLNVICGQLLTRYGGEEPVFDLSVPKVQSMDSDDWHHLRDHPESVCLMVDEEPMILRLTVAA
ncbi:MAG: chemotaxis protein CheX [Phycisphaeraceae bacterium]|nr:chemotaxis protein CheX [Phycisphaeraceae bacterium]